MPAHVNDAAAIVAEHAEPAWSGSLSGYTHLVFTQTDYVKVAPFKSMMVA
ncbi:MAG: hypothetical protein RMN25_04435 [Anaerolineae bacterium]|nr:hypothetical protein [Thermoflexales bacterium]MDW8407010.1 hypothetical protein [Anaerolineae bacterium]